MKVLRRVRLVACGGAAALLLGTAPAAWADLISGTPGDDTLMGTPRADQINAGAGDDVAHGRGGNDTVNGGLGTDVLTGDIGRDTLRGGDGADTMRGGVGPDVLYTLGADTAFGGGQNDWISMGPGEATARGGYGADSIGVDATGDQTLMGEDGDDLLASASGRCEAPSRRSRQRQPAFPRRRPHAGRRGRQRLVVLVLHERAARRSR